MNNLPASFSELLPIMEEQLNNGQKVSFTVNGTSMQPMIISGKDSVVLRKPNGRLKKYDLPFYRRDDGQFVLHRVVKLQKDGNYTCRGDNQIINEPDGRPDQIIGVVESFTHKGKDWSVESFWYKLYCRLWMSMRFFRRVVGRLKRIKNRIFGR